MKFYVDFTDVAKFSIDLQSFQNFLNDRIKVEGKTGNLGSKVTVSVEGNKVAVVAQPPFSKRYLKYLSKKYLKANDMREFMHVVASDKATYKIKLYKVMDDNEE